MIKQTISGEEARQKLLNGANKIANAIVSTMGPKGKTVIFEGSVGQPISTKDGVTVAKQFELEDKFENLGSNMIKQVSMKMNDDVGDGTTSVSCLARILMNECNKNIVAGADPTEIKKGLELGSKKVVEFLKGMSKEVETKEDIFKIARISANDDEIGQIIADIVDKTGKDGLITVEESQSLELTSESVDGFEFNAGFATPYMVNDETRTKAMYDDVALLITERKIEAITDLIPLVEEMAASGTKQLVILADDITDEVLSTLVLNKLKGLFNTLVIKAPLFGIKRKELLEDIAVLTGATIVNEETGINFKSLKIEHLGRVGKVISKRDKTAFIDSKGDKKKVKERIKQLENEAKVVKGEFSKEKLRIRLAHLNSSVGVIKVGGTTEMELKEKKYRIDDALCATRAANSEGILPGGGIALYRSLEALEGEEGEGIKILRKALLEPITCISRNAGHDPAVVIHEVDNKPEGIGFDASKGEYVNMIEEGIIDPTKVVKESLENAVSITIQFLSTDTLIALKEDIDINAVRSE